MHGKVDQYMIEEGLGWSHEVEDQHAPAGFEHAINFRESAQFKIIRQVVHHQTGGDHIHAVVGEGECFDYTYTEINIKILALRFITSHCDHLWRGINAIDFAFFACTNLR